jgi:hypothetical protein
MNWGLMLPLSIAEMTDGTMVFLHQEIEGDVSSTPPPPVHPGSRP